MAKKKKKLQKKTLKKERVIPFLVLYYGREREYILEDTFKFTETDLYNFLDEMDKLFSKIRVIEVRTWSPNWVNKKLLPDDPHPTMTLTEPYLTHFNTLYIE